MVFAAYTDAEYAELYLAEMDLRAQLIAIRQLLRRNAQAEETVSAEIEKLADEAKQATGEYGEHVIDLWIDELHGSVFQSAANSMAAVGMLAPLVESVFVQLFRQLGQLRNEGKQHEREVRAHAEFWDPHHVHRSGGRDDDLVAGISQLSGMVGLEPRLPADYKQVLSALFAYRNAMFHNGFEWPKEFRTRFQNRMKSWPSAWFSSSTQGGEPWIFYLTPAFIERCLSFIDEVLAAFGALVRGSANSEADVEAP